MALVVMLTPLVGKAGRGLAVAGVAAGLAGCDVGPRFVLLNGLDQPVTLHIKSHYRARETNIVLTPGRAKGFDGEDADGGFYSVTVAGCELAYGFPSIDSPLNHPWVITDSRGNKTPDYRYPYPVWQVLKDDFRLYLGNSKKAAAEQAHGFPLSPISKVCTADWKGDGPKSNPPSM